MPIPFRYRLKWIRLKSSVMDTLVSWWHWMRATFQDKRHAMGRWIGLALLMVLAVGCGPFGISFQIDQGGVQSSGSEEAPTRTPFSQVTPTPTAILDWGGDVPQSVWMPFTQGTTEDGSVITVRPNQVGFEKSPVEFSMYWDYSGATGKLAYASEFFHAARGSSTSVSDLWVYDYVTQKASMWLPDNIARAAWAPLETGHFSDQRLAAAIYNTEEGRFDLGLVSGPGQVEWLANCASPQFSWSPDATEIAYVATSLGKDDRGVPPECQGVYVVSLGTGDVRRVSDAPNLYGGWSGDRPIWADDQGSLLFSGASPESVFWVIKGDGSPPIAASMGANIQEDYLPRPQFSLWSPDHHSVIGQTEGMMDPFGVWVYKFSDDLNTIEDAYRINWGDYSHDIMLVGWWEPGESVLLRDITNTSALNPFGVAMVWSLSDQYAFELSYSRPVIDVPTYPSEARTGVSQVDQVIENFLVRKYQFRRDLIRMANVACTTVEAEVGPPSCPEGVADGTKIQVFPYEEHRMAEYVAPDALDKFLEFPLGGLYAVYRTPSDGFKADWYPVGEYSVVFVTQDGEQGVEMSVDSAGKVVRIAFWPMTPVEFLHDTDFDYLLPPLAQ